MTGLDTTSTAILPRDNYNTLAKASALELNWPWLRSLARRKYVKHEWEDIVQEAVRKFLECNIIIANEDHARAILTFKLREAFRDLVLDGQEHESIEELAEKGIEFPNDDDPQASAEKAEIRKAISRLHPEPRAVLTLRLEGHTFRRTADTLKIELGRAFEQEKQAVKILKRLFFIAA
jgi:DNA-directed RNA polymerase specialized sigma24 family protein